MSSDTPTMSEVGEENVKCYLKRRHLHTVYMTTPDSFCPYCKETDDPLEFHCLVKKCAHPETACEFVKAGGERG